MKIRDNAILFKNGDISGFVALFYNIGMLSQIIDVLCVIILGDQIPAVTVASKLLICVLLLLSVYLVIKKGYIVELSVLSAVWLALHIIAFLIDNRISIFATRIIVYSYGYLVIGALLIAMIDDVSILIQKFTNYIFVSAVFCFIQFFYFRKTGLYSMQFSYYTLSSAVLCYLLGHKKHIYMLLFFLFIISDLLFGSRGCFLCFTIAIFLYQILFHNSGRRVIVLSIFISILSILIFNYRLMAQTLLGVFPNSRALIYLSVGDIHMSGREKYYVNIWEAIKESQFYPHGLYSDRFFMANFHGRYSMEDIYGSYAHNILLEVLYQFGWIGFFVLYFMMSKLIESYKMIKKDNDDMKFLWIIATSFCVGQLLVSASYLTSVSFGLLVGVLMLASKRKKETIVYRSPISG